MRVRPGRTNDFPRGFRSLMVTAVPAAAGCVMPDTIYRIVQRDDESFAVEIDRVGALPQTAAGFATEALAQGWIAQDQRLNSTEDTFSTPAGRRWRGSIARRTMI
jgi:hypothetical protein